MALLAVSPAAGRAQEEDARRLSLEEALALAAERSEDVAMARASLARARAEVRRARSELFPQLSGSASYDRSLASEFSGLFDEAEMPVPCAPFMPHPEATLEERVAELERAVDCGAEGSAAPGDGFGDLPFGRANTWRANLSLSQNLWSGGRIGAQTELARAGREAAEVRLLSSRARALLAVVRAYHDLSLSESFVEIAEVSLRQAEGVVQQARLAFEVGAVPEFDVLRAQVARDNLRPTLIRSRAAQRIAAVRLRQLLDLPAGEPLVLTTRLDAAEAPPPGPFPEVAAREVASAAILARAPVREAQAFVRLQEAAVEAAEAQRRPLVAFNSQYGEVAYPTGFFPSFGDFRRNWTVGVGLQVPLLTGGRLSAEEAMARADLAEAEARLQQVRELALVDTRTAEEELGAARAAWEATAATVREAGRAYEIAELRYRSGVSTQLELSDARLALARARADRAQAARDLQVARARLALLPDLPLGGEPALPMTMEPPPPGGAPVAPMLQRVGRPASPGAPLPLAGNEQVPR